MLLAFADLDGGAAVAGEDEEDLVIEMAQQIGAAAGRDIDHLQRDEIAAAAQMHEGRLAAAAKPRPGRGLDGVEVDRRRLR